MLQALCEIDRGEGRCEEADDGQAELGYRQEPAGIVEQPADPTGARRALLDELLDPAPPNRDEGDLRCDEESLEQGQQDDDEDVEH